MPANIHSAALMGALVIPLLTAACSVGSIDVTDAGDFGRARSAFWVPSFDLGDTVVYDQSTGTVNTGIGYFATGLQVHDKKRSCEDYQAEIQAWADASRALLEASQGGDDLDAFCAGIPDFLLSRGDTGGAPEPTRSLSISCAFNGTCQDMDEGSYAIDPAANTDARGSLSFLDGEVGRQEYWQNAADRWDVDACAYSEAAPEDEGDVTYVLTDGTFDVVSDEDDQLEVELDAKLLDEDAQEAGSVSAQLSVELCELEDLESVVIIF